MLTNLYNVKQIQEWDQFTIKNEPIASIDLMERASVNFVSWFIRRYDSTKNIMIFAGNGNNGGDALAIGRLLSNLNYAVTIYHVRFGSNFSEDCKLNLSRLEKPPYEIASENDISELPVTNENTIIIDGIFGSGLTRKAEGNYQLLIDKLNTLPGIKIAIDVPSGLFCDRLNGADDSVFYADLVVSFQIPKQAFLFPENQKHIGEFHVIDIGLSKDYNKSVISNWKYIGDKQHSFSRLKFSHKGTFGHALLISGSKGKMGAATLCSRAALKTGCGLVTSHIPHDENSIQQTAFPEGMTSLSKGKTVITDFPDLATYNAIGIGPGLGKAPETREMLYSLLKEVKVPLVIDADALNIIAEENWMEHVPKNSILTPHPKEFERLFGKTNNSIEALEQQRKASIQHQVFIVKKGAHTSISSPKGILFFNSSGNPGMATAGSGDVLTGIITSLLAQGYPEKRAAIHGVYIHGKAGDIAAKKIGEQSITASDLITTL